MERDAKVKYRGIQIGEVESIDYAGDQAKLTLAIAATNCGHPVQRGRPHRRHNGFRCQVGGVRAARQASGSTLRPGAQVQASAVQLEVNTLFQTLTDVLQDRPVHLNATLSALAEGCAARRRPRRPARRLNYYLQQLNPKLPTLQQDSRRPAWSRTSTATQAGSGRIFDNAPAISNTIVDEQDNLNRRCWRPPAWPTTAPPRWSRRRTTTSPPSTGCARR